ncbi:glycophorin-C [Tamandua tetradactyla]|uniref:glycophorin-C n=1 Tax=Tamandua tetradactyla TaxID=48850 RepID=UPI0040549D50
MGPSPGPAAGERNTRAVSSRGERPGAGWGRRTLCAASAGAWDPSAMSSSNVTAQPGDQPDPGIASTATDITIIAGVVSAIALVLACLLFVLLHYQCRQKGVYYTNEAKGTEFAESADVVLEGESSKKEYFI